MQGGERYNSISDHLKSEFGRKTVKLSIDAGFTCPNRDGSAGTSYRPLSYNIPRDRAART